MVNFFTYVNSGLGPYMGTLIFILIVIGALGVSIIGCIYAVKNPKLIEDEQKEKDGNSSIYGKPIPISTEQINQIFKGFNKKKDGKTFH